MQSEQSAKLETVYQGAKRTVQHNFTTQQIIKCVACLLRQCLHLRFFFKNTFSMINFYEKRIWQNKPLLFRR